MTKIDSNDLLTITQAADLRGVSRQAIDDLIARNKLSVIEIAGKKFLSKREVNAYEPDTGGRPLKTKVKSKKASKKA